MKKLVIVFTLSFATSAMAQTNYNTCMNPKKDSVKREINLHLKKAKVLNTIGDILTASAFASAIYGYYVGKTEKSMIFIPLTIGIGALITKTLADKQQEKGEKIK